VTVIATGKALGERARRFLNRRLSFRDCFMDANGQLTMAGASVLRQFARKAGAYKSTFRSDLAGRADPIAMARAEGRREMYLFLQTMLELPDREVLNALDPDE
jgi:hypothetical protein